MATDQDPLSITNPSNIRFSKVFEEELAEVSRRRIPVDSTNGAEKQNEEAGDQQITIEEMKTAFEKTYGGQLEKLHEKIKKIDEEIANITDPQILNKKSLTKEAAAKRLQWFKGFKTEVYKHLNIIEKETEELVKATDPQVRQDLTLVKEAAEKRLQWLNDFKTEVDKQFDLIEKETEELVKATDPQVRQRMTLIIETAKQRIQQIEAFRMDMVGLALSGGGIRSATFCLGVLQALAECKLLSRIDYLSTVSGGGYIGGWLAAWIKREGEVPNVENQLAPNRITQADAKRDGIPDLAFDEGPEPVHHLRAYSNYLAPRPGLFSVDGWVLITIYARNLVLNQLVMLFAMLCVLFGVFIVVKFFACVAYVEDIPRWENAAKASAIASALGEAGFSTNPLQAGLLAQNCLVDMLSSPNDNTIERSNQHIAFATSVNIKIQSAYIQSFRGNHTWTTGEYRRFTWFNPLFIASLIFLGVGKFLIYLRLVRLRQSKGEKNNPEARPTLNLILFPLFISAISASLFSIYVLGPADARWDWGIVFSVILSVLIVKIISSIFAMGCAWKNWDTQEGSVKSSIYIVWGISWLVAAILGGLLLYALLFYLHWITDKTNIAIPAITTFAPPLVLVALVIMLILQIGFQGQAYLEEQREWWSSLCAWIMIYATGWLCLFGIVVFGPWLFLSLGSIRQGQWLSQVMATLVWLVSVGLDHRFEQ